ncbi:hypothetical protein PRABACTJOHN_03687 [Parabacteroides johnsonii DSM 18315]|uniref:Uncharacterized protein n=1 Tax=Parabacteroides johnsonii DSM 18315 TaxID=537006 RepID=B7BF58_9BACT|nr:hypothetical protein PRABACTJOHN_03687 [Parabacteroides johnsonii DSM 18315]
MKFNGLNFSFPFSGSSFGFLVGIDFLCRIGSGKGQMGQVNGRRILRNTQIYDLRKAAAKIRNPLA